MARRIQVQNPARQAASNGQSTAPAPGASQPVAPVQRASIGSWLKDNKPLINTLLLLVALAVAIVAIFTFPGLTSNPGKIKALAVEVLIIVGCLCVFIGDKPKKVVTILAFLLAGCLVVVFLGKSPADLGKSVAGAVKSAVASKSVKEAVVYQGDVVFQPNSKSITRAVVRPGDKVYFSGATKPFRFYDPRKGGLTVISTDTCIEISVGGVIVVHGDEDAGSVHMEVVSNRS